MTVGRKNLDLNKLSETLLSWLKNRLNHDAFQKMESTFNRLKKEAEDWDVFSSFSAVPRYTGKKPLELTIKEKEQAQNLRSGWEPAHWTVDQLGRTLFLIGIAERSKNEFLEKLEKIFISSDLSEGIALYQSIPVLPYPHDLKSRAAEGVRSNITSHFNAIALRNPYPAGYLDDDAWNQLVLKALFIGSSLYLIQGIDRRANSTLAHMLIEYAHERWAAGRNVSPELWRPVGPFIGKDYIGEIEKVLHHTDEIQKQAATIALLSSNSPEAWKLLKDNHELVKKVKQKGITWEDIGKKFESMSV